MPPSETRPIRCYALGGREDLPQNRVGGELSILHREVDAGQILHHHGARAEVEVTDLGVAHLPVGQTDRRDRRPSAGCAESAPTARRIRGCAPGRSAFPDCPGRVPIRRARPGRMRAPAATWARQAARAVRPRSSRRRDDRRERLGIKAGAADERAVDIGQRQELGGILGLDAAAVEDAGQLRPAPWRTAATRARTNATASCACSGVATRPVPIAQIGS